MSQPTPAQEYDLAKFYALSELDRLDSLSDIVESRLRRDDIAGARVFLDALNRSAGVLNQHIHQMQWATRHAQEAIGS